MMPELDDANFREVLKLDIVLPSSGIINLDVHGKNLQILRGIQDKSKLAKLSSRYAIEVGDYNRKHVDKNGNVLVYSGGVSMRISAERFDEKSIRSLLKRIGTLHNYGVNRFDVLESSEMQRFFPKHVEQTRAGSVGGNLRTY